MFPWEWHSWFDWYEHEHSVQNAYFLANRISDISEIGEAYDGVEETHDEVGDHNVVGIRDDADKKDQLPTWSNATIWYPLRWCQGESGGVEVGDVGDDESGLGLGELKLESWL